MAFALIGSVLHMRKTIKSTNFVLPNDHLVSVHMILFAAWLLTWIVREFIAAKIQSLFKELEDQEGSSQIFD